MRPHHSRRHHLGTHLLGTVLRGTCLAAALALPAADLPAQWIRPLDNTTQLERGYAVASDPITLGFYTNIRGSLDDQMTFGNQVYVCTKGFVSFFPLAGFCPISPDASDVPGGIAVLAPYFRDLILYNLNAGAASTVGSIYWGDALVNGRQAWGATWEDVLSATFVPNENSGQDYRNTFQMMLIDRGDRAFGDFDVEFNYGWLGSSPSSSTGLLFAGAYDIGGLPDANGDPYGEYRYEVTPVANSRITLCWVSGSIDIAACTPGSGGPTDPIPVPEPATWTLLVAGLAMLLRRRVPLRMTLPIGLLFTVAACSDAPSGGSTSASPLASDMLSNDPVDLDQNEGWLVVFKPGTTANQRKAALDAAQAGVSWELQYVEGVVIRTGDLDALRNSSVVEAVYENSVFGTNQAYQTNALYWRRGMQWDMRQIEAHLAATRGTGVKVCVIDGPVPSTHREFTGKVAAATHIPGASGWGLTADAISHGAHVASTISTNGVGLASVAPGAMILSANVAGPTLKAPLAKVIEGIMWCVQHQADVINMSFGGPRLRSGTTWKSDSAAFWVYTTIARLNGAVVIASAGNDGVALPSSVTAYAPAEVPGVISVGATGPAPTRTFPFVPQAPHPSFDQLPNYSNRNSGNNTLGEGVRIYAPGGTQADLSQLRIFGVCNAVATMRNCAGADTYYATMGTSMAAPHVSGVVALITERYAGRARNMARTNDITNCLLQTSDPLPAGSPFFGRGRVNARRATTEACPGL